MPNKSDIILFIPHVKDNTTSVNRFESIAARLVSKYSCTKLVYFDFPAENIFGKAHKRQASLQLNTHLQSKLLIIPPKLNWLQKYTFKKFSSGNLASAKIFNRIHTLIFGMDVFYPGAFHPNKLPSKLGVVISFGGLGLSWSAMKYAKKWGYKFLIDYRDPLTFGYSAVDSVSLLHGLRVLRQRSLELRLLNAADLVTVVSPTLKEQFPSSFKSKIAVVPNGSNVTDATPNPTPSHFHVTYAGTVYDDQLHELAFFEAFRLFLKDKNLATVNLNFIGSSKSNKLKQVLSQFGLQRISNITQRVGKEQMNSYLENSSIFLHLRYGNRSGIITSKQADYLAYRKPILLPVSDNGDLAESILTNKAGFVCNGLEETLAVLERQYALFANGKSCVIDQDKEFLLKNARGYWAGEFVKLVDELLGNSTIGSD